MNSLPKIGFNDSQKNHRPLRPGAPTKRSLSLSPPPINRATNVQKKWVQPPTRCQSLSPSLVYNRHSLPESFKGKASVCSLEEENIIADKLAELSVASDQAKVSIPHGVVSKINRTIVSKKKEFLKLRTQFLAQQNAVIEQLTTLKEMENKAGLPPDDSLGEVTVLALKPWPAHDLVLLVKDVLDLALPSDTVSYFGAKVLQKMHLKLVPLPDQVKKLCAQLIDSRNELINMVQPKSKTSKNACLSALEAKALRSHNAQENEKLLSLAEESCGKVKRAIEKSLKLAMLPWIDRDILIKTVEKLEKENTILQTKLAEATKTTESISHPDQKLDDGQQERVNSLTEELNKEKASRAALKDAVSAAEGLLRAARARVLSLEKQMKEMRSELESTRRKLKDMELFQKQRETTLDARSKKLMEVSKTGEDTIETLLKQRDALEQRVRELHEQTEMGNIEAQKRIVQEKCKQEKLQSKFSEQDRDCNKLRTKCETLEANVRDLQMDLEKMREYSSQLVAFGKVKCLDYIPVKETNPTPDDTRLWIELQEARDDLGRKDEELKQIREDKERFLQSLYNIAKGGGEEKEDTMAAALVEKERVIAEMQKTIRDLKEHQKSTEQLKKEFAQKMNELRMENHRLKHYECYSKEVPYQDLQNELIDLNMRVEAQARERSTLVSAAASRSLMLERHERAMEMFTKMTRARHELATYLTDRSRPGYATQPMQLSEISRSLTSLFTDAADTWSALRAERLRTFRLESAVLSQDQQLEREARLRTDMQDRRAALERELMRCHALLDAQKAVTQQDTY